MVDVLPEIVASRLEGTEGAVVFAVSLPLFLVIRWWVLRQLQRHDSGPDSFFHAASLYLTGPSLLWCLAGALELGLEASQLDERYSSVVKNVILAFVILSMALMTNAILQRGISRLPFVMAGISRTLGRILVFGLGLMVLLQLWGISITPVLTGLGVAGIAVALALQDTLSNFFAGVHLLVEAPLKVGDFVRISPEEEGTITDIGWRTTRILTPANSIVVVPNKMMTTSSLINYSMPEDRVAVWIPVIAGLEADGRQVERIAIQAALETPGVIQDPPPLLIVDPGLTPTHLQFRLAFQVERQLGSGLIRSAVFQNLHGRMQNEGIPVPEISRVLAGKALI